LVNNWEYLLKIIRGLVFALSFSTIVFATFIVGSKAWSVNMSCKPVKLLAMGICLETL
jgi:hypothetical protein